MTRPELWIVAGPNGAGKTTCVQREPISLLLPEVSFQNPDDRTRAKLVSLGYEGFHDAPIEVQTRLFFESADEVFTDLQFAIQHDHTVGVETVLSSGKYVSLVEAVRARNGYVRLIYVALSSPDIAKVRVAARVKQGGHGIPDDKIEQRWKRSLENLAWFATKATAFWIVDNSDSNPICARLLARGSLGIIDYLDEAIFPEMRVALSSLKQN